jgi:RHS repeat-associated protein
MLEPARQYSVSGYRYGFNGKENDNEVKGEGNQQDYGMRIYDPRLGRFLSVDPLAKSYPMLTPYQFATNTPIMAIDLNGKEALVVTGSISGFGLFFGGEVGAGVAITPTGISIIQASNVKLGGGVYMGAAINFTYLPTVKNDKDLADLGFGVSADLGELVSVSGSVEYSSSGWAVTASKGVGEGAYAAFQFSYTNVIKTFTWKDIGVLVVKQSTNPDVAKLLLETFNMNPDEGTTPEKLFQGYKKFINEVATQRVKTLETEITNSTKRVSEIDNALSILNNSGWLTRLFTLQKRLELKGEKNELKKKIEGQEKEIETLQTTQREVNNLKMGG